MTGGSGIEALDQAIADFGEIGAGAQDHGAATESGAGEAGADGARSHGGVHQAIERGATDAQAIAKAGVPIEEDPAEAGELIFAECAGGALN